jgi:DNA polymerase delta subunit 1
MQNEIYLQPFKWEVVDSFGEDEVVQIQCWALDREDKPHLLRIEDYPASCFVELPLYIEKRRVEWSQSSVEAFILSLMQKLGASAPKDFAFIHKPKLYYFQAEKKYPMVQLTFNNLQALKDCARLLSRPFYFKGQGRARAYIWEDKIPYLRKFWTRVNIEPAQWFRVTYKKEPLESISLLKDEYIASWKDIKPLTGEETQGWMTHPKMLSFDIESYSLNHKAFPNKYSTPDVCYLISAITQRIGLPETRKKQCIVFGDCHEIPDVIIRKVKTEIDLIHTFAEIVREEDPDILTGYNIHEYDYDYLDARLERVMEEWRPMGRLLDDKTEKETRSWSSAAYGHNEMVILKMSGRISVDGMLVKRDYKLPRYDLDTVSKFFLGRGKHPIKAADIFQAYEDLMNAKKKGVGTEEYKKAVDYFTRIVEYCLEDSTLVIDILEKIFWWIASVELANIVGVQIVDLYTRGQQIRCLSKIYDVAHRLGYVLDFKEPLNVVFNGGSVEKPEEGVEDEVPAYDVSSMYPSIIISDNIDYTTFVPEHLEETVPDEKCNIIEFDQLERPKKVSDKVNEEDFDPDTEVGDEAKLVHRKIRFLKKEYREGIVPRIVAMLIAERKKVKGTLKPLEKAKEKGETYDEVRYAVLDRRQWALKITANSFFGFLGAYIGKLPLIEAGMAITAKGRAIIAATKTYLREKYGATIKYGDTDSVMPKFYHLEGLPWAEKLTFWRRVNDELSAMFPGIIFELEKIMRILTFAPKMYAYLVYNDQGELTNDPMKMSSKGIILARRDGTQWVREHYRRILFNILWNYSTNSEKEIQSILGSFQMILEAALEMVEGRVDWHDLAKINEVSTKERSPIAPLVAHLREIGRPTQPGDRLKYIICDIPGETKVGGKMRTDEEFLESQETDTPLRLDVKYYLENALQKKLDPLFEAGYHRLVPQLASIGYKPNSLKHYVSVSSPVKMITRMIEDGMDVRGLGEWFKEEISINYQRNRRVAIVKKKSKPEILVLE